MKLRKTVMIKETMATDHSGVTCDPITKVAVMAVVKNPFAGKCSDDLSPLFSLGREIGEHLMADVVAMLGKPAVGYGKAAIVGVAGDLEHGAAIIHPMLGKPMREAVGGGESLIPSTAKLAGAGAHIDIPLSHKDDMWSFDHLDTISIMVPDAPLADEVVICMAVTDGGRPYPRTGSGPIKD